MDEIEERYQYWCCDEYFVGPNAFRAHLCNHHVPPLICGQEGCPRDFRHQTSLFRHIRNEHMHLGEDTDSSSSASASASINNDNNSWQSQESNNVVDNNSSVSEADEPIDLKKAAADLVLNLRSTGGVTSALIERFQDACTTMIDNVTSMQQQSVRRFLDRFNLTDNDEAQDLLRELSFENPFQHIRTLKQQLTYFSREMGLVLPIPHFIGYRSEWRLDPTTNQYEATQSSMVFQYVPIVETLKLVLSNPRMRYLINNERASNDGVLRSYLDGTRSKCNRLIQEHPHTIRLQIYIDDLEVVNALGSRTSVHKLSAMYFSIQNLPPVEASELSTIFLLGLAYTEDLKNVNGYEKFFYPFLEDLKKLESPEGVTFTIDGEEVCVHATLCILAADTLAAHEVLGFLSPSARHFCRKCMVARGEFVQNCKALGELRSKATFDAHVQQIADRTLNPTECGIKKACPLHEAKYFSAPEDSPFDIFHDLLEGVCHLTILLALRYFINDKKFFSLNEFHSRLISFNYGIPDSRNKPSANFTEEKLQSKHFLQKGSQTWCLSRVFGFLVPEVPTDDRYLKLINLLQQCMLIVFSLEIRPSDITKLELLTDEYLDLFQQMHIGVLDALQEEEAEEEEEGREGAALYAVRQVIRQVSPINKLHHFHHYADIIRELGPPVRFWCMRYEARHHIFNKYGTVCCNFIQLPKTMSEMLQMCTLADIRRTSFRADDMEIYSGQYTPVGDSDHSELLHSVGLDFTDIVSDVKAVILVSEDFRPGLFLVLDPVIPAFAIVQRVYSHEDRHIFLIIKPWKTEEFEERYCAYRVVPDPDSVPQILRHTELKHHKAFAPWNPYGKRITYIAPRTVIF